MAQYSTSHKRESERSLCSTVVSIITIVTRMTEIGFFISMLHHVAMLPKDLIVFDTDDFSTPRKD